MKEDLNLHDENHQKIMSLTKSERMRKCRIKEISKNYDFEFDINNTKIFKEYLYEEISVYHKACGRTYSTKLNDFRRMSSGSLQILLKYVECKNDLHCPYCLQEAKNKYFQDKLNELYGKEFELIGDYINSKSRVKIRHLVCGETFEIGAGVIFSKKKKLCPSCKKTKNRYSKKVLKEKTEKFRIELKERGLGSFDILSDYIDARTEVLFIHKECGYEFKDTPKKFLKRLNKCPNCNPRGQRMFNSQKEKNDYYQSELDAVKKGFKIRSNCISKNKEILLYHEECNKEFKVALAPFLKKKCKCPHCHPNRYKYSMDITIKEKIRYFERELGGEYNILTGFTTIEDEVELRHKRCGRVFKKRIGQALRPRLNISLCPYCELEKRRKAFLDKLYSKWGDAYEMVGEYVSIKTPTLFRHKLCGKVFEIIPERLLDKTCNTCPHCKEDNFHKGEKFKLKLFKKHKSRYSMLSEYKSHNERILFRDNECGSTFWEKPTNVLKKDLPCKKCSSLKRYIPFDEVLNRISKCNGDLYKLAGEYMGTEREMPVMCTHCGHVFEIKPARLFRVKLCPKCKSKDTKRKSSI